MSSSLIEDIAIQNLETVTTLKALRSVRIPLAAAPDMAVGSICLNLAGTSILVRNAAGAVTTIS